MEKGNTKEWGRTTPRRDRATENLLLSGLPPSVPKLRHVDNSENGRLLVRGDRLIDRVFVILMWVSILFTSAFVWFLIIKLFVAWYIPIRPEGYGRGVGPWNPSNLKTAREYMERKKNEPRSN